MVLPALAELRRNPRDPKLLKRWSRNNLIVQSLCAAVGLMGFAMQLLGAATPIALTLYAIAVGYLFLLRPAQPLSCSAECGGELFAIRQLLHGIDVRLLSAISCLRSSI